MNDARKNLLLGAGNGFVIGLAIGAAVTFYSAQADAQTVFLVPPAHYVDAGRAQLGTLATIEFVGAGHMAALPCASQAAVRADVALGLTLHGCTLWWPATGRWTVYILDALVGKERDRAVDHELAHVGGWPPDHGAGQ